jgi:hypothetical protein
MGQSRLDVDHLKRDVMKAFSSGRQETTNRGVIAERHEQLQVRTPDRHHRLLDPLLDDHLTVLRNHAVLRGEIGQGLIEVPHRHRGVVDVE